jgi:hypothetical protein
MPATKVQRLIRYLADQMQGVTEGLRSRAPQALRVSMCLTGAGLRTRHRTSVWRSPSRRTVGRREGGQWRIRHRTSGLLGRSHHRRDRLRWSSRRHRTTCAHLCKDTRVSLSSFCSGQHGTAEILRPSCTSTRRSQVTTTRTIVRRLPLPRPVVDVPCSALAP